LQRSRVAFVSLPQPVPQPVCPPVQASLPASVSPRRPLRALLRGTVLAGALALAGCGGGGGGSSTPPAVDPGTGSGGGGTVEPKTVSAGPGCDLVYTLTQSAVLTGTDPLLALQWHLRNSGQTGGTAGEDLRAVDAWGSSRGAGVRVAVIDDAIEVVHADLLPNLVDGASRSYRSGNRGSVWPLPCSSGTDPVTLEAKEVHGTAVAGIVLGRDDNALGGAGVAPRASLVAFDALISRQDADIVDALLRDSALNAIYQNSWGAPDSDGALHAAAPAFAAAIRTGIETGRGGLGSIYVFPGGNGGCFAADLSGNCVSDNANFDGFVNRLGTIAVCAVDHAGRRPWYGEPGANLLVCAPSSGDAKNVVTTTIRGGFRQDFSGTSASTPQVSGVVALMLAANPTLTWRDVRLILAKTARRNDPANPDWEPAAGGRMFSHQFGFGVADARAAVAAATGWSSVGGSAQLKTCTLPERAPGIAIPDAPTDPAIPPTPATDSLNIAATDCGITQIEYVEVRVTTTHTYSGDLRIRLISPQGAVSRLAESRICKGDGSDPCGAFDGWTFGSSRHLDEPATGTWTLQLADTVELDTGRLEKWSLTLYGR
jgi:proprotein convertase subtilisin/kexin type 2